MSDTRTIALTVTCPTRCPSDGWTDEDVVGLIAAALFLHSAIPVHAVRWESTTWAKDDA